MEVHLADSRPSRKGPPEWFTGTVWINPVVEAPEPCRVMAVHVTFEPGARTAWHTHPLGQTLHVLSGTGLVAKRGERPQVIRPGDTVWIAPGEEHWHGAGPDAAMVHLAVQERLDGRVADWLELVNDEDYRQTPL
ncbi:cupin domain-containing protein [Ruegeria sediminis]|uniref:Cupin domain-containing protein n=1 Tax=Ruegeria sediminis TaxID=2583820 RepID=A0ABY2WWF4_9RHOB|nr:cupin domain-containing protein [Ruegeria sediminis]TMV06767.1 cupin domain-containing protein [Ruegeria sediminis]